MTLHLDDLEAGQVYDVGTVEVTEDEVLDFARRFDPQPFHVDPVAAAASPYGGIIASGWHTCALYMRLFAENLLAGASSQGSPGVDQVRWLAPVRPGDRLRGAATVERVTPSVSRPDRGAVTFSCQLVNQHDVTAMRMTATVFFGRRPG